MAPDRSPPVARAAVVALSMVVAVLVAALPAFGHDNGTTAHLWNAHIARWPIRA